jgi:hypothetical protein
MSPRIHKRSSVKYIVRLPIAHAPEEIADVA